VPGVDSRAAEDQVLRTFDPDPARPGTTHGEVEAWFNNDLTDGRIGGIYYSEDDPDGDFDNLDDALPADDEATYRRTVAARERSRPSTPTWTKC